VNSCDTLDRLSQSLAALAPIAKHVESHIHYYNKHMQPSPPQGDSPSIGCTAYRPQWHRACLTMSHLTMPCKSGCRSRRAMLGRATLTDSTAGARLVLCNLVERLQITSKHAPVCQGAMDEPKGRSPCILQLGLRRCHHHSWYSLRWSRRSKSSKCYRMPGKPRLHSICSGNNPSCRQWGTVKLTAVRVKAVSAARNTSVAVQEQVCSASQARVAPRTLGHGAQFCNLNLG